MKNILYLLPVTLAFFMQACDKIEAPYGEGGGTPAANSITIDAGTITGSITEYSVSSATESDTSILYATWYYAESNDTSFASIIFTWNGQKSDSVKTFVTPKGPVHIDDTLSIAAGSPYGTLTFHYIADIDTSGNGEGTVIVIIAQAQAVKKVLLFDFTGHQCVYCPRAARTATSLESVYGEQLITIALHCGSFANVNASGPFSYDFRTPEGNQLLGDLQISSFPNGSINFLKKNNSYLIAYTAWGSTISNELKKAPQADITMTTDYQSVTRELTASISASFINSMSGNYNLAVYLTEDSIINWQKDADANPVDNPNYVHMHVFRTSFTGTYGEQVASGPSAGTSIDKQYTITVNSGFNENHCSVVAFLLDAATKEIVQAEKVKLFP